MEQKQPDTKQSNPSKGELPKCKVLIIGNSTVGKSSLLNRYVNGEFNQKQNMTIGHDFQLKDELVDNINVRLQIWDTSGQEKYRPTIKSYFKGAKGVFLVFDVLDRKSFEDIKYWLREIKYIESNYAKILLGNKYDLIDDQDTKQILSLEEIQSFADDHGMKFFYSSAKTGMNIQEGFKQLATEILSMNKDTIVYQNEKKQSPVQNKDKKLNKNSDYCTNKCW